MQLVWRLAWDTKLVKPEDPLFIPMAATLETKMPGSKIAMEVSWINPGRPIQFNT